MIQELLSDFGDISKTWREEATRRRRVTAADPGADTLDFCATELEKKVAEVRASTVRLSVAEYAELKNVSDQTIVNWIHRGWLKAERGTKGFLIDPKAEPDKTAKAS